jgi:hypothetical protein
MHTSGTYEVPEHTAGDRSIEPSFQNTPGTYDSGIAASTTSFPNAAGIPTPFQTQSIQISRENSSHRSRTRIFRDTISNSYWKGEALDLGNVDLVCTVDTTKISNRWLADFIPSFNQRVKNHPPSITQFISHIFKTYPAILLREGHLPPFIHSAQLSGSEAPTPLANCLSLVRMWDVQVRGSENMVRDIVKNEMNRLYEEVDIRFPHVAELTIVFFAAPIVSST